MSYEAPFAGLRVVDLSQGIAGPYAGMLLAQYGADVVKVEPPGGDWARALGRRYGDHTAFSIAANLGKRSIALELRTAEGQAVLQRLVARADVLLESFRPGAAARLGVGWEEASASNPRLLYVSVSGFGQTGPDRERPAVDNVVQAFTGFISANLGGDGIPHRVPVVVMDMATALYAFQALAVALYARRDEPRGRRLEVSLVQGGAALQVVRMMAHYLEGGPPQPGLTPSGTFATREGWINISILRDADFPRLCAILGIPEAAGDPRFATNDFRHRHAAELTRLLASAFARATTAEWCERLAPSGIMHAPVHDYLEFLRHPQVEAAGLISWIEHPEAGRVPVPNVPGLRALPSVGARARAPRLDEHRAEILGEIGLLAPAPGRG